MTAGLEGMRVAVLALAAAARVEPARQIVRKDLVLARAWAPTRLRYGVALRTLTARVVTP